MLAAEHVTEVYCPCGCRDALDNVLASAGAVILTWTT